MLDDIGDLLDEAITAHEAKDLNLAALKYSKILEKDSQHPDANHNFALLAIELDCIEEALPYLQTAIKTNPYVPQYWVTFVDTLTNIGKFDDAKSLLNQASAFGYEDEVFKHLRHNLDRKRHEYTSIRNINPIDEFKPKEIRSNAKISNKPDPPEIRTQRIITLYNQGHLEKVLLKASQLLLEFPNSAILYNIIATANKDLNKLKEAITAYKKAISLQPTFAEAYNNMGLTLHEQGKWDDAIQAYNTALHLKPDCAETYNNLGDVFQKRGNVDKEIKARKKALSIKPDFVQAYKNLGDALRKQNKLEEAIGSYTKAISFKPDFAEAYNNLGTVFQEQGRLREALEIYNRAISLKPDYVIAYNNLGTIFYKMGRVKEAIEALNKAISIEPDDNTAWYNLYYPLQTMKTLVSSTEDLRTLFPKNSGSKSAKTQEALLHYKLHRGQKEEVKYLRSALNNISTANNLTIQNPRYTESTNEQMHVFPNKFVALVHFGRSGTGLMHSLIDGHPEISTLPSIYFCEYFDNSTWNEIISDGWDGMVDRFISLYEVLLDSRSSAPIQTKGKELKYNMGIKEGMANVGDQKNEIVTLDKDIFCSKLKRLVNHQEKMDAFLFFKLVHSAYDNTISDYNVKNLIFYHIHNPDTYAQLNFVKFAPKASWLMMVREPIQSCESWIRINFKNSEYSGITNSILTMLFEVDNNIYSTQRSIGIRLEDLKRKPKKTIQALCKWMDIKQSNKLYNMTAQGKKWWGDPTSPDYAKDGMDPFGQTSINRKMGSIFSNNDRLIFSTFFYPFSVQFGYIPEDPELFQANLKTVRPLLDEMFDFEKALLKNMSIKAKQFMKSGAYLYFRSGLIERWNTLNEFHTYPNMIKPLKV